MSGQLDGVDASEPARFGRAHAGTALPRLAAVVELMAGLPEARAFVEVKRASLVHHGRAHCVERILAVLAPVLERCIVISFDADAARLARTSAGVPIGWVLDGDPVQLRSLIELMRPEFIFCDHRRLPAGTNAAVRLLGLGRVRGDRRAPRARARRARRCDGRIDGALAARRRTRIV
jgi:glycerophosphoryl diester phosphodiesterase